MFTNQNYLKGQQYKTSSNLNTRAGLHERFGVSKYGWHKWVFDQFNFESGYRVLEVGCGPAYLWNENIERVPSDVRFVLGDLSIGMASETKTKLAASEAKNFNFFNGDAESIPFPANYFDAVIANHMLYHLPHLDLGVRELARVLKPNGVLYAATNGMPHLKEMLELAHEFDPNYGSVHHRGFFESLNFRLENAEEILKAAFARVEIRNYDDHLWVTEAAPLVNYVLSGWRDQVREGMIESFIAFVEERIKREGGVRITKESGLVIARK